MTAGFDKIPISLQLQEAQAHARELNSGKGRASDIELRRRTANAIVSTLMFCRDHEDEIREYMRSKKAASE